MDGICRAMDVMLAGKTAMVCRFGDVGKGSAESPAGQKCRVLVSEVDPIPNKKTAWVHKPSSFPKSFYVNNFFIYIATITFFPYPTQSRKLWYWIICPYILITYR